MQRYCQKYFYIMDHNSFILCFSTLFIMSFIVNDVLACDGYSLKNVEIAPCDGTKNIMKITDYGVELTKDCKLIPSGCFESTKDINAFSIDYEFNRNNIPIKKGTIENGCNAVDKMSNDLKVMIDTLGFPKQCPMKAGKICGGPEKAVSIQKYKVSLPTMVGKTSGKYTIKTNAGNSCFKFSNQMVFNGMQAGKSVMKNIPMVGK